MKKKTIILSVFIAALLLTTPLFADAAARTKKYTGTVLYRSGDYIKIKVGPTQYKVKVDSARTYLKDNSSKANINHFKRGDRVQVTGKYSEADKILTASRVKLLDKSKRPNRLRVKIKSFDKSNGLIIAKRGHTAYKIYYDKNTIFLNKYKKKSKHTELKRNKNFYFYGTLTGTKMTNVAQVYRKR